MNVNTHILIFPLFTLQLDSNTSEFSSQNLKVVQGIIYLNCEGGGEGGKERGEEGEGRGGGEGEGILVIGIFKADTKLAASSYQPFQFYTSFFTTVFVLIEASLFPPPDCTTDLLIFPPVSFTSINLFSFSRRLFLRHTSVHAMSPC